MGDSPGNDPSAQESPADSIHIAAVSDGPADKDVLGFRPYVDAIARFLMSDNTRAPLTISIEGAWGSGKSSFMRQLEDALALASPSPKRAPLVVKFNAWRHDKDESLWASFATSFSDQIAEQQPWWRRTVGRLGLMWNQLSAAGFLPIILWLALVLVLGFVGVEAFRHAKAHLPEAGKVLDGKVNLEHLLTWLGPVGAFVAIVLTTLQQAMKTLGNPLKTNLKKYLRRPDYDSRQAFIEIFHKDFKRTIDAFAGDERIFVFVDDLDRCDVPRAADLMQALSLLIADDPRIVFVLGMDREKVAAGIAFKFKELIPYLHRGGEAPDNTFVHLDFGHEFLEKFIQIVFPLPLPSPVALQRFVDTLGRSVPPPRRRRWLSEQWRQLREAFWGNRRQRRDYAPEKPDQPSALSAPSSEAQTAAKRDQRRFRDLGFETDSDRIKRIVRGVAPTLGYNPRRIKQFLNLFRLRSYIALETGLLDEIGEQKGLSLEQIGKIVVLSMRWPDLIAEWMLDRDLMKVLESPDAPLMTRYGRWWRNNAVLDVVRSDLGSKSADTRLSLVPIDEVFRVSPAVPRPTRGAGNAPEATAVRMARPLFTDQLLSLAREYEAIRASMPSGDERTAKMTEIISHMQHLGRDLRLDGGALTERFSNLPDGERLIVVALLPFLGRGAASIASDAIRESRSAFEQFHALVGVEEMLSRLNPEERAHLHVAIGESLPRTEGDLSRSDLAVHLMAELGGIPAGNVSSSRGPGERMARDNEPA
jgi:hypothetical protein